jgi:hypothetical protein
VGAALGSDQLRQAKGRVTEAAADVEAASPGGRGMQCERGFADRSQSRLDQIALAEPDVEQRPIPSCGLLDVVLHPASLFVFQIQPVGDGPSVVSGRPIVSGRSPTPQAARATGRAAFKSTRSERPGRTSCRSAALLGIHHSRTGSHESREQEIRFDNLKSGVKKVLKGRRRVESDRFVALRSHDLFASQFTSPGLEGAHEKGGVGGEVWRYRRNRLVPVPELRNLAELNALLLAETGAHVKGAQNSAVPTHATDARTRVGSLERR